jgi:hypothetical protein
VGQPLLRLPESRTSPNCARMLRSAAHSPRPQRSAPFPFSVFCCIAISIQLPAFDARAQINVRRTRIHPPSNCARESAWRTTCTSPLPLALRARNAPHHFPFHFSLYSHFYTAPSVWRVRARISMSGALGSTRPRTAHARAHGELRAHRRCPLLSAPAPQRFPLLLCIHLCTAPCAWRTGEDKSPPGAVRPTRSRTAGAHGDPHAHRHCPCACSSRARNAPQCCPFTLYSHLRTAPNVWRAGAR